MTPEDFDTEPESDEWILAGGCCGLGWNGAAADNAAPSRSLPAIEQEVIAGIRTIAEYRAELAAAGYSDSQADQLVQLAQAIAERTPRQQLCRS